MALDCFWKDSAAHHFIDFCNSNRADIIPFALEMLQKKVENVELCARNTTIWKSATRKAAKEDIGLSFRVWTPDPCDTAWLWALLVVSGDMLIFGRERNWYVSYLGFKKVFADVLNVLWFAKFKFHVTFGIELSWYTRPNFVLCTHTVSKLEYRTKTPILYSV